MASDNVVALTASNFKSEVLESPLPVLVDFWAEWCGPCKMMGPVVDAVAENYAGKIRVGKVNIDEDQTLASEFGIQSIPTLLIFKQGQVVDQMVGMRSKRDLLTSLDKAIAS